MRSWCRCLNAFNFAFSSCAAHVNNEGMFATNLERLGNAALSSNEADIGSSFLKFTVFSKELSALFKSLVSARCDVNICL